VNGTRTQTRSKTRRWAAGSHRWRGGVPTPRAFEVRGPPPASPIQGATPQLNGAHVWVYTGHVHTALMVRAPAGAAAGSGAARRGAGRVAAQRGGLGCAGSHGGAAARVTVAGCRGRLDVVDRAGAAATWHAAWQPKGHLLPRARNLERGQKAKCRGRDGLAAPQGGARRGCRGQRRRPPCRRRSSNSSSSSSSILAGVQQGGAGGSVQEQPGGVKGTGVQVVERVEALV
jgi:hypothetical protein